MTAPSTDSTARKKAQFVAALQTKKCVTSAAKCIRMDRSTVYLWRDKDPEFARAWDDALENVVDLLEASMFERAIAGDTTAAIFMLKSWRPEKYRESVRVELIRKEADRWAREYGLDPDEVIREAESIAKGGV